MTPPQPQRNPRAQQEIINAMLNGEIPPIVMQQTTYHIHGGQVNTGTMYGQQAAGGYGPPPYGAPPSGMPIPGSPPDAYQNQIQPYRPQPVFQSYTDVEAWFFGLDDKDPLTFETRLHFLVMAIFAGNSLRFIEAVKKLLESRLHVKMAQVVESNKKRKGQRPTSTPPAPPIFQRNLSEIITRTSTRVDTREMGRRQGMTQVCEFTDARYQIHALSFLSTSPDLQVFRDEFRGWLEGICRADDGSLEQQRDAAMARVAALLKDASLRTMTRIQAAIGLGEFAKNDYQHYYRTLIMPYARGFIGAANPFNNALVLGWMLYQLATDPRYTDTIFEMVKGWASIDGYGYLITPAGSAEELIYQLAQVSLIYTATMIVTPLSFLNLQRALPIISELIVQTEVPYQTVLLYHAIQPAYRIADNATYMLAMFSEWQQRPGDNKINIKRADLGIRFFLVLIGAAIELQGQSTAPETNGALQPLETNGALQPLEANALSQIETTIGSTDPSDPNNKVSARTIWDVILRGKQSGMNHPEASLEILVKYALRHPEARLVDQMTDILAQWIILGDQRPELGNYIYYVLREIKRYKYGYRVIMRLCQSRAFSNSHMARHLLHAQ